MALQVPPTHVQKAPTDLEAGRRALHEGRLPEAQARLEAWLARHPDDADALVAYGFAGLRMDRLPLAEATFRKALGHSPADVDAQYGLGLVLLRLGRPTEAKPLLRTALTKDPTRTDVQEALGHALAAAPDPLPPLPPLVRPAQLQMPARAHGTAFEVRDAKGRWQPLFLKGINLGAALPGKYPSQFPDEATYRTWIAEMAELGVNCLRVYTVHPPHFYQVLREHNARAQAAGKPPIWLIHGVWTELPPEDDFRDPAWYGEWKQEMRNVVDLLHGHANLQPRPGHSSGAYRADVSPWTLAIILGREWEPFSLEAFHAKYPGTSDWQGRFVGIQGGTAIEVFMADAMEAMLAYEHDTYHAQRPMAYTNWPTLDPLTHPTEATKVEELAWRKKLGLPVDKLQIREYDNDAFGLDMQKVTEGKELKAGLFASYHAYPYYPDFINLDPGYRQGRDAVGPNNYAAYLDELVKHHTKHPVVISEIGVPSSRLAAHWQPQGFTHGGQDEVAQGEQDVRFLQNIHAAGGAGGILFAWIDEWFKKNWLVIEFEEPLDRKPLWYNVQDAEENYGLIGMRPGTGGPTILIDGKAEDWEKVPVYQQGQGMTLKLKADEGWLHVGLFLDNGLPDWSKEAFLLGLDTYDPALGSHQLPWGVPLRSEAGLESVVLFHGGGDTALYLDEPYDLFTHRYSRPYRTLAHEGGSFLMPRTESNRDRVGRDGTRFPGHQQEIGWLRRGTQDRKDPAFDSRSEWIEGRLPDGRGFLEARLPWGLMNVTDPSSHQVVQDTVPPGDGVGLATTPGFRILLARLAASASPTQGGAAITATLPAAKAGTIPSAPLFAWPGWEEPTWHSFRKLGFGIVKKGIAALPNRPEPAKSR
ncbi:MAG TPA: tetratricopeptide repeat protein [Holophagaceae bacterium]|nr:tetratricopeptide repeat protein [Holophagaceae bacterium]